MYVAICVSLCVYVSLCAVVSRQMLCITGVSLSKLKDSDRAKQMQKRTVCLLGCTMAAMGLWQRGGMWKGQGNIQHWK